MKVISIKLIEVIRLVELLVLAGEAYESNGIDQGLAMYSVSEVKAPC